MNLDKITIEKAIKKAEAEQRDHLRIMEMKGQELGEIQKQIKQQKETIAAANDRITALQLNKGMKAEQLHTMKVREGEIKGTIRAFAKMLNSIIAA